MRWLLCLFLLSCSGGGGSNVQPTTPAAVVPPVPQTVPPSATYDWRDYTPLRGPSYQASGWKSVQTSATTFNIFWGDDYWEEQRIAPNPADSGKLWVFLDSYDSPLTRVVSVTTRAEIDRFDGKGWVDINPPLEMQTSAYLPVEIGANGLRIRTWGWAYIDGKPVNRWFWTTEIRPREAVYNSCWLLNDATRPTMFIQEAWWDQQQAWTDRGTGDIDTQTREPNGENIKYFFWIHNALMVKAGDGQLHGGYAWQYGYPNTSPRCAQY